MALDQSARSRQRSYEDTIINYVNDEQGHIITLSDDQSFITQVRVTLAKALGLTSPDLVTSIIDPHQLLNAIRGLVGRHPAPTLFIERILAGQDLSFLVSQARQTFAALRIIVLTTDMQRDRLMLLHEAGADNFIAKPVSANTLIEKMACTLSPQSRLGKAIDHAKRLLGCQKYQEALAACRKILEVKPGYAAAWLIIGDVERALKDYEKARIAYENASKSADVYLAPMQRLAEMYGEQGDTERQMQYLQKLDELSPLNVNRKISLGELHLAKGDTEAAEALFDKAMTQVTKEAMDSISSLSGRIASIYADKGVPGKAEKFLRESINIKGKFLSRSDLMLFNQLGISLRQQGRWMDAITEYKRAIKIAPDDENLYYNMGMAFAEGSDFIQAKANLLKALDLNPDLTAASPNIAYNFGAVFLQSHERERAAQFFQVALQQKPDFPAAIEGLKRAGG